ncbi:MAG TPA: hypothetical protein VNJ08_04880 [Bacteriovoracaceae bacterium]|nr:hypothetical protein [Bacteriovoracaceae bacterium]
MKKFILVLAVFMMSLSSSFAGHRMYLKKVYSLYNSTGSYVLTCKFYSNKVEITENTGTESSLRVEPTAYSGTTFASLITSASSRSLLSAPFNLCDGGSLWTRAYRASGTYFTLKKFEDCGPTVKTRSGTAARTLRNIVERYCVSFGQK